MKNSNLLIIALLAITVATSSSAYYLFTRSQISADTNDPGLPSIPGMAGFDPTATPLPVPPVPTIPTSTPASPAATSTLAVQGTATSNPNNLTQNTSSSQSANSDSTSESSSGSSTSSTGRTVAGNSGRFTTTPAASVTASAEIAAIGIITETPIFTAVPEQATPTKTKAGSNSTVWILIIVALAAIGSLGYVLFRKKPGQIDQMNTIGQAPAGSIPPENSAMPQATAPANVYVAPPVIQAPPVAPTQPPAPQNSDNQPPSLN